MNWVLAVLSTLESVFRLWGAAEANKYRDQYMALRRDLLEEKNRKRPNQARIDLIYRELYVLCEHVNTATAGAAEITGSNPPPAS